MGFCGKIIWAGLFIIFAIFGKAIYDISRPLPPPKLDLNAYWGNGDSSKYEEDISIYQANVAYKPEVIEKLKHRLTDYTETTEPLQNTAFNYGFDHNELLKIVKYWNTTYLKSYTTHEIGLNRYPHFFTEIQGLRIHFLQMKSTRNAHLKNHYPLLLLHGWPGSVREFFDLIPHLLNNDDNKDYTFEVIVPSLPGYGWSQGAARPGMGTPEIAVIMRNLMLKLGYKKFFIQGGDWGAAIGSNMAQLFPENILGFHSNMCFNMAPIAQMKNFIASFYPKLFIEEKYVKWFFPFSSKFSNMLRETGYMHIQATKPDTIGAALSNNPVGLAAYILEKFSTWTNKDYINLKDGGLKKSYKLDALLDNVMIYYLTNSITTSVRLYSEALSPRQFKMSLDRVPIHVPTACAAFEHDLAHTIEWSLKDKYTNLLQYTLYENGGHFPALEHPMILYKDFINFTNKVLKK